LDTSETPVLFGRDGGIGTVTLNRPAAMNAITTVLAHELNVAIRTLSGECDVIVIRGAGGNFSVGGDFTELDELRAEGEPELRKLFEGFRTVCDVIAAVPVPVIAAVEGFALGGGLELMLGADISIVAEDAQLGERYINFDQIPAGGSTQRLPRFVGPQRALGLILSGDRISGAEAAEWGIAYRAVPAAELDETVDEFARRLAGKSRVALAKSKALVRKGLELPLSRGVSLELEAALAHLYGTDAATGIRELARER
jgi:enoyl-CoA hydratase/carnithine racemase